MDYKETLNLPFTKFPMKANLSQKEPLRLEKWEKEKLYEKILAERDSNHKYVLHDGPPYANGNIHIGHALNKILKDFIVKIKSTEGYYSPYVPGWDCHGLPIEHQVDKKLGKKKRDMTVAQIRKHCREYATKFIDIQRTEFKRLGILGEWENPYITMDYRYEAITLKELYDIYNKGGVYIGSKPVYWCTSCVTALAEAEVEYDNHTSPSIYVKFPLKDDAKKQLGLDLNSDISAVIWTTTPWTLPANMGICLHPDFEYSVIKVTESENKNIKQNELLIFATEMIDKIKDDLKIGNYETVAKYKGTDFEKTNAKHAFYDRNSLFVLGDHVTLEAGTGLVHTAPGHGQEDYVVGLEYGLEILNPVDDYGRFKKDVEIFGGQKIVPANDEIIKYLDENGNLLKLAKIEHSYPHCWRCKKPVIFRATPQWFISMENNDLREKALNAIQNEVKWTPSWGQNRIYSMIENRPDWCISRQRTWGVPIALFVCSECGEIHTNEEIQKRVVDAFFKEGADAWFEKDNEFFLGEFTTCQKCGSSNIRKTKDILDVWFDSGVSHAAVCEDRGYLHPVNMYLEGSDQHRGWFHSSLLESVATRGKAPYKEVLTHGFVVDGKGMKMSKSVGNVVTPEEIVKKHGAEILRLWVSAEDYSEDIRISKDIINRLSEAYRKIRNTARYILGNISDFDYDKENISFENKMELDKYILIRWQEVKKNIYKAYDKYQFHTFYHAFLNFCIVDLSQFYLDIVKDRLYASNKSSLKRKSCQSTLFELIREMSIVMSPILSFTADEVWEYIPDYSNKKDFVFMETFPKIENYSDNLLESKWENILSIRKEVNKALELARAEKVIGHSLDSKITLEISNELAKFLDVDEGIEKIFIVSELEVVSENELEGGYVSEDGQIKIKVKPSELDKCERCWVHDATVGKNSKHPTICQRCVDALD
jgi:isoleucyl-tRNA synthetase